MGLGVAVLFLGLSGWSLPLLLASFLLRTFRSILPSHGRRNPLLVPLNLPLHLIISLMPDKLNHLTIPLHPMIGTGTRALKILMPFIEGRLHNDILMMRLAEDTVLAATLVLADAFAMAVTVVLLLVAVGLA